MKAIAAVGAAVVVAVAVGAAVVAIAQRAPLARIQTDKPAAPQKKNKKYSKFFLYFTGII